MIGGDGARALLRDGPRVINVGLESFALDLDARGVPVLHVAWRPPAGGDVAALQVRLEAAQQNFQEDLDDVDAELAGLGREWDAAVDFGGDESKKQALLARMNEVLNRRAYIRNLVAGVQKELGS